MLSCSIGQAQNLVPNGSFEQYSNCPFTIQTFDSLLFWFNPTLATPDAFNVCANPWMVVGVPNNFNGYQYARSGDGYAGILRWINAPANWREYLEVKLISPLVANTCYHFEMYINQGNESRITTSKTGIYFSNTMITQFGSSNPLPFVPQINDTSGLLTDTLNWILVSGNYTASGGEEYLTIGNFNANATTDTMTVNPNALWFDSYIFIDDVCLTACSSLCSTVGIQEPNQNDEINIYPNPFTNTLIIENKDNKFSDFILYDITSRKLLQQKFTNSVTINTAQFAKGIYIYEVRCSGSLCKKGKVVKD